MTDHKGNQGKPKRRRLTGLMAFVLAFSFIVGPLMAPTPAYAIPVEDIPAQTDRVVEKVKKFFKDTLLSGATTAIINAANHFATSMAYQLGTALSAECNGQQPCWNTMSLGDMSKNAGKGAIGEAVGSLNEEWNLKELIGLDLCKPSANFTLKIQLGMLGTANPPDAKCDFNDIVKNYKEAAQSLEWENLKKHSWVQFEPGSSPLSASLEINEAMSVQAGEKQSQQLWQTFMNYAGGQGFKDIIDPVSKRKKAPASEVAAKAEERRENAPGGKEAKAQNKALTTGQVAYGHVATIVSNAVSTFGQALVSGYWNRLVDGLLSPEEAIEAEPDIVLSLDATPSPSAKSIAKALKPRYTMPPIAEVGSYDPILEMSSCLDGYRGPLNCVIDGKFATAINVSQGGLPVTVRDALDQGLLNGDWPLIPATDIARNTQSWCYRVGYCESNLKKLRAARILPLGWEIAASKSSSGDSAVTLKTVVDNFNNCNADKQADSNYPWCHLIDPDWVLKQPIGQCQAKAFSAHLLSPEGPGRLEMCVDPVSCLREDDFGTCTGGWGHCTRERNVWRFKADSCPSYYNSCRQLTPATGGTSQSFLLNTIDHSSCNADNVGCTRYSARQNSLRCDLPTGPCTDENGCLCPVKESCQLVLGERYCLAPSGAICDYADTSLTSVSCQSSACKCDAVRNCRVETGKTFCNVNDGDSKDLTDDWMKIPARFYNSKAQACNLSDIGCSHLLKLQTGESLNLVKNGSFSNRDDFDGDGATDGAVFWMPVGKIPSGERGEVIDGQVRMGSTTGLSAGIANCSLSSGECRQDLGCACTDNDGYGCLVPFGKTDCSTIREVGQTGIPFRPAQVYTLSADFVSDGTAATGYAELYFVDALKERVNLSTDLVVVGDTPTAGVDCLRASGGNKGDMIRLSAQLDGSVVPVRASCTFSVSQDSGAQPIKEADLYLRGSTGTVFADNVQLEQGGGTAFHDGYGSANVQAYLKVPPEYLGCSGETDDAAACASYAQACRETEVGCRRYTPINGDPAVPGVASANDFCPSACEGYDMYKQEASEFESSEKFPVYFVPSTATSCTAADVGCSEFTDVETEQVSHYRQLRICQNPGDHNDEAVFYTWEGSDTQGYQLKTWRLKQTAAAVAYDATDKDNLCPEDTSCTQGQTLGNAPCTWLEEGDPSACDDGKVDANGDLAGHCSAEDAKTDLDCREFYDADGNRYFRLQSRTIAVTPDCERLRITDSNKSDCERTNGEWDDARNACFYNVQPSDSASCSAAVSGCRSYRGNTAADTRQVFLEGFDEGLGDWSVQNSTGLSVSAESVTAGGKSLHLGSTAATDATASLEVGGKVAAGRLYSVQFWAKGGGTVSVDLRNGNSSVNRSCTVDATTCSNQVAGTGCDCLTEGGYKCTADTADIGPECSVPPQDTTHVYSFVSDEQLSGDWRQYSFGPIDPTSMKDANGNALPSASGTWGENEIYIRLTKSGNSSSYIDNVILKEVRDSFAVVRDSWITPASCDQTVAGAASQYEMLGCRQYSDDLNNTVYLRSFTSLCRNSAVGCTAYSKTYQNDEIWPVTYQTACYLSGNGKCTPSLTKGGTSCRCDYDLGYRNSTLDEPTVMLPDVCRIPIGGSYCTFTLDGRLGAKDLAAHPDSFEVPADHRVFLVANSSSACSVAAAGCTGYGKATVSYEGKCELKDSSGVLTACKPGEDSDGKAKTGTVKAAEEAGKYCYCTDADTGHVCQVDEGQKTCTFGSEEADVKSWKTVALLDDPDKYDQIACRESEVGCQGWTASGVTYYFKDPGSQTCKYERTVSYLGQTVSGWFRTSESGQVFPCYPELKKNGNQYEVYKNADVQCTLENRCQGPGTCGCYPPKASPKCTVLFNGSSCTAEGKTYDLGKTCKNSSGCKYYDVSPLCSVAPGFLSCGYKGWVAKCEPKYDRCEEFIDPSSTSALQPEGQPYYYIANTKLDTESCSGTVNLRQGCVLFNQTSNKQLLYSSSATYLRSETEGAGSARSVSSVNCSIPNRSSYCNKRCFRYHNGTCSSDALVTCSQDSDCGTTDPLTGKVTGGQCQGLEVYGFGCSQDSDCSGEEKCFADTREISVASGGFGGVTSSDPNRKDIVQGRYFTRNDANTIIKVSPDRECAAWLQCSNETVDWDSQANKWRLTCNEFGTCTKLEDSGVGTDCDVWETPKLERLDLDHYTARNVGWRGEDYSGYSVYDQYPSQYLRPVNVNQGLCRDEDGDLRKGPFEACRSSADCTTGLNDYCDTPYEGICITPNVSSTSDPQPCTCSEKKTSDEYVKCDTGSYCSCAKMSMLRFGIPDDPKTVVNSASADFGKPFAGCQSDDDCKLVPGDASKHASCLAGHCWLDVFGQPLSASDRLAAPSCRAYPEEDAPFPPSVLDDRDGDGGFNEYGEGEDRVTAYANANVCIEDNDCECAYTRVNHGPGRGSSRFYSYSTDQSLDPNFSPVDDSSKFVARCVGGTEHGKVCTGAKPAANQDDECPGGSCTAPQSNTKAYGWPGFCLDYDKSLNVMNDQKLYGCNVWLPVDQLSGLPSQYNQHREAGWFPETGQQEINFCQWSEDTHVDYDLKANSSVNQLISDFPPYNVVSASSGLKYNLKVETDAKWTCFLDVIFAWIGCAAGNPVACGYAISGTAEEVTDDHTGAPPDGCSLGERKTAAAKLTGIPNTDPEYNECLPFICPITATSKAQFEACPPVPANAISAGSSNWTLFFPKATYDLNNDNYYCKSGEDMQWVADNCMTPPAEAPDGKQPTVVEAGGFTDGDDDAEGVTFAIAKNTKIYRDQIAAIEIVFNDDNDDATYRQALYLKNDPWDPGEFRNSFSWGKGGSDFPGCPLASKNEGPQPDNWDEKGNKICELTPTEYDGDANGPLSLCKDNERCSDAFSYVKDNKYTLEWYCSKRDTDKSANTVMARAGWTGDQLTAIHIGYCHAHKDCNKDVDVVEINVYLRENCMQLTNVWAGNKEGSEGFPGAPLTNTLYKAEKNNPGTYKPLTTHPKISPKNMDPFGRAILAAASNLDGWGMNEHQPIPVYKSEGGSEYTQVSAVCKNDNCSEYAFDKDGYDPDFLAESDPAPQVAGVPAGPDANSGLNAIMNWFAIAWKTHLWNKTDDMYVANPKGTETGINLYQDYRGTKVVPGSTPKVVPVLSNLSCTEGVCGEGAKPGLTVNNNPGLSDVESEEAGKLKATITFYGYADSEQMPIRRKVVDFWGGIMSGDSGVTLGSATVSTGYFKNHRGYEANANICGSDDNDFGKIDRGCDKRYFEEKATYLCNDQIWDMLEPCGADGPYPCQSHDSNNNDACAYKPRVQLLDNWGSCSSGSGSTHGDGCPGGSAGSACLNGNIEASSVTSQQLDNLHTSSGVDDECVIGTDATPFEPWDNLNKNLAADQQIKPWVSFGARILVEKK